MKPTPYGTSVNKKRRKEKKEIPQDAPPGLSKCSNIPWAGAAQQTEPHCS